IGTITFQSNPPPFHQWTLLGCDQIIAFQLLCEAASAPPQSPPIRAWLELDGKPNHQVIRFQMIAPSRTQMVTLEVMTASLASTRPVVMVWATALPNSIAPARFVTAARNTACRGVSTLVDTTVAMELAVS